MVLRISSWFGLRWMVLLLISSGITHVIVVIWWLDWGWMIWDVLLTFWLSGRHLSPCSLLLSRRLTQTSLHGSQRVPRKKKQRLHGTLRSKRWTLLESLLPHSIYWSKKWRKKLHLCWEEQQDHIAKEQTCIDRKNWWLLQPAMLPLLYGWSYLLSIYLHFNNSHLIARRESCGCSKPP